MIKLTEREKQICQNPVKAIRRKCIDCSGWNQREVELCPLTECTLYPFRFGKNPFRTKREVSDEQREAMKQRLAEARKRRTDEKV